MVCLLWKCEVSDFKNLSNVNTYGTLKSTLEFSYYSLNGSSRKKNLFDLEEKRRREEEKK